MAIWELHLLRLQNGSLWKLRDIDLDYGRSPNFDACGSSISSTFLINDNEEIQSPKKDDNPDNIVEVPEGLEFQRQKDVAEKGEQQKLHGKIGIEKKRKEEEFLELPNFSLELSREQISEDIYGMTGKTPSRTLKKREKNVQKQIELIFPGGSLKAITVGKYKV
ncbi:uncharacterized protein [Primulina huaijiensis]|uniref:uncharacterized protein isoform X2 n=1 Tax=Primulina huaijiensis TaxID=1492673 RepID=UPI003CC74D2C